jgi:hypothetical protein
MKSNDLDPRALSLFRIGLAILVLADTLIALGNCFTFYSDSGVLPLAQLLAGDTGETSLSLYFACRWWVWSVFLLFFQLILAFFLLLGLRVPVVAPVLAYLVYSLQGRNPFIVGLADRWILLLLVGCAVTEVSRYWSAQPSKPSKGPEGRPAAFYLLALIVPAGITHAAVFSESRTLFPTETEAIVLFWGWLAFTSLLCLFQEREYQAIRNLAAVVLATQFLWLFGASRLSLLSGLTAVAFLVLEKPDPSEGEEETIANIIGHQVTKFALLVLLIQAWSVLALTGSVNSPEVMVLRESALSSQNFQKLGISSGRGSQELETLWSQLKSPTYQMKRALNSLAGRGDHRSWQSFITYHHRSLAHPDPETARYKVYDLSGTHPVLLQEIVPTRPQPPLLEGLPPLNRDDAQKKEK